MSVVLGRRFVRADGLEKVTGQGRYTADLVLPGMLHASLLYAGRPHARITSLDTSAARTLPGVLAVATHEDVPDLLYGAIVKDRRLFAKDIVRFEADIVAAVAALTPAIADEACRLIRVEYEDLEPVLDSVDALEPGSPLVHADWASYEVSAGTIRKGNDCGFANIVKGDVERGFAEADEIVEERYVADMSHPVPIEPHAVLAQWEGSKVTIWSSSQVPFAARSGVAESLQVPESSVRVIVPYLGGGFGGKCDFHFEAHVAALARKAGRPVRLVFDRREEFTAIDMARHAITTEVKTGVRRDGTITAMTARLYLDTGAYAAHGPACSDIATMMAAGPYRIPNLLIEASASYTNKTPAGSTRAPTGPQVCWAVEQHLDVLAERVGMDPVAFRLANVAEEGDEGPTGQRFDSIGMRECLEQAAELIGWRDAPPDGEGVGIACGWWFSYPTTSGAYVTLNTDGTATIVTGAQENGSGAVMGLALIAAEELGLEPEQISIHYQDTDSGLWDMGSSGSQTTFNVGRALIAAAGEVREQLLAMAAEELEAAPEDLELVEGHVRAKDAPRKSVAVAELAAKADGEGRLILGRGSPPMPAHPDNFGATACLGRTSFPAFAAPTFFCHAARVRVDRDTGVVRVLEVAAAHDFGRVINPIGAEGQVEGGVAHALGMALTEGTLYGDGRQLNPHLLDYKLQTAADTPGVKIAFVEAPAPNGGPYGTKGVGEPPVVPTAGAVANAIARATGARVRRLPMTPYRVWEAVSGGKA
jgi:CO/xanthine dehydrogenase Mo-binding subunit